MAALAAVPVADAGPRELRAKRTHAGYAVFELPRSIDPSSVGAVRVRVGRHKRLISAARVRRVVRRSQQPKLRVWLKRAERRPSQRRTPRLLIFPKRAAAWDQRDPKDTNGVEPTNSTDSTGPADLTTTPAQPESPTSDAVPTGPKSTFRAPFSPVLSDAEAAARVRPSGPELRPGNTERNRTVPTAEQLERFRQANATLYGPHKQLVTGNFRGTTDEIIQWAAWKWGIDEDVFRAQAVQETWWDTNVAGDNGESFGLFQIKGWVHEGTYPLSVDSTAFNADYTGALFRWYYDGHATWVMDFEHGKDYAPGDQWGAIGAHFAGRWWTSGAEDYVRKVKAHTADRTWEQRGF